MTDQEAFDHLDRGMESSEPVETEAEAELGPQPFVEPDRPMVVWKEKEAVAAGSIGSGGKKAAAIVGGVALAACLGIGGVVALSGGSGDESSDSTETALPRSDDETDTTPDTAATAPVNEPVDLPDTTVAPVVDETSDTTLETTTTVTPEQLASADGDAMEFLSDDLAKRIAADDPVTWAIYTPEGKIRLQGEIPSQELVDKQIEAVTAVMGEGNVINELTVNPAVEDTGGGPVYVEQAILYESGSAELGEDFLPLLDLGIVLFAVDPMVQVTLVGHTDSDGDEDANLALSAARIEAAFQYFRDRDVDTSRLIADPRGESSPIADNDTEEGKRLNRRIEIIIEGFAQG